jgi:HEAT repeat protein
VKKSVGEQTDQLAIALELLKDPQAKNRVAAAKRLRKMADPKAGRPLLAALKKEVLDSRTWSAQYAMTLALGFCKYRPALPFLWEFARTELEYTTIFYGLGDAIVRIQRRSANDVSPILEIIKTKRYMMVDGAFRAMAMLQMVPSADEIAKILQVAELKEAVKAVQGYPNDPAGLRRWVAAAAAGWPRELVEAFLRRCLLINDSQLKMAAEQSLLGKYVKWGPY